MQSGPTRPASLARSPLCGLSPTTRRHAGCSLQGSSCFGRCDSARTLRAVPQQASTIRGMRTMRVNGGLPPLAGCSFSCNRRRWSRCRCRSPSSSRRTLPSPDCDCRTTPEPSSFWQPSQALADRQLRRFKLYPSNAGLVCDAGLWRWSRHPNYFFEWLGWWAYPIIALSPGYAWGWASLAAPAIMYWILVHVTGIPPLEEQMLQSRGDRYREYQARTNAFFPWPPNDGR